MKQIQWIEDLVCLFTKTEEDTQTLTNRLSAAWYEERQTVGAGALFIGMAIGSLLTYWLMS